MEKIGWILLFFLLVTRTAAQETSFLNSISQEGALDLYLSVDWKDIARNKQDKVYQACIVRLTSESQDSLLLVGKVKTRGHMRLEICSFPPLKLKFDKSELAKCGLSPLNEMDIVQQCHEGEQYDQYILREYLAYKLWELISPYHFKVQLVHLHYINPDGSIAHESSYAFLVENTEELVARLDGKRYNAGLISKNAVDKKTFLSVALFQFMIGNTDWYIPNRHNLDFVSLPGHSFLVTVPYDFDYSGLVSAPYATAHATLNLPSVDLRYYQGWCHTKEEVDEALRIFHDQKGNILSMPSRIEGLNEKSIKYLTSYLSDFFEIIENPKKLESQIIRHCDQWPVRD